MAVSVCGRFGLWPFRLWPFTFVAVLTIILVMCHSYHHVTVVIEDCGRLGVWPFRFVAVSVCGCFGLWPFTLWPFTFVAVLTIILVMYHSYHHSTSFAHLNSLWPSDIIWPNRTRFWLVHEIDYLVFDSKPMQACFYQLDPWEKIFSEIQIKKKNFSVKYIAFENVICNIYGSHFVQVNQNDALQYVSCFVPILSMKKILVHQLD